MVLDKTRVVTRALKESYVNGVTTMVRGKDDIENRSLDEFIRVYSALEHALDQENPVESYRIARERTLPLSTPTSVSLRRLLQTAYAVGCVTPSIVFCGTLAGVTYLFYEGIKSVAQ